MKTCTAPGTFDPITSGHLDVITRAAQLVDEVVVAVAASPKKKPLFSLEERAELVRRATSHLPNVRVEPFDELLVDLAAKLDATVVIKGLRAITDFEYEFQMTALNYQLNQELETCSSCRRRSTCICRRLSCARSRACTATWRSSSPHA